ncbi:reverse transcriptase domain-containing protein, partial [Tanacetum coccineum]
MEMRMEATLMEEVAGTERAVGLARWFEKMESVFHISNYEIKCQVKYATCTMLDGAQTWWNSHVKMVGIDATYDMSWKDLMKLITEIYTQCFQKLALLCPKMVPDEEEKIKRQAENKRRMKNNPRDNHVQQLPYKRHNVARSYTTGPGEKKEYTGNLPLCNKCKLHHTRPCTAKCRNCKRVGHLTKDCRSPAAAANQRAPLANEKTTNQNHGNQTGNGEAQGRVYALGGGEANQDLNVVT